jgi:hypothetical protein
MRLELDAADSGGRADLNAWPQLLCLWSGPLMLLLFWFGFMYCAGYLPPPSAELAPAELVLRIQNNLTGFRIGMLVTMIGFSLMVPWAAGIAALVRSSEGRYTVLSHIQIASAAIGSLIGQGATWIFEAVAYRLNDTDPFIIRALHDLAWFTFLAPWPSFTIWCFAQAMAILRDTHEPPALPRWCGFLSLWTGILFVPACLIFWFKVGPFSWNGLIAFYVPVFIFFIWVVGLTVPALMAVHRDAANTKTTRSSEDNMTIRTSGIDGG